MNRVILISQLSMRSKKMQNYYLLLLLHVGQRAEKCSLRPLAIHQSYCDLSHKRRKLLHENAAVFEENLCDLSQHITYIFKYVMGLSWNWSLQ